jgi:hypothetical protein
MHAVITAQSSKIATTRHHPAEAALIFRGNSSASPPLDILEEPAGYSTIFAESQRPVAIRALLWRLRMESGASFCFDQDNRQAMRSALTDPAAAGPLPKGA